MPLFQCGNPDCGQGRSYIFEARVPICPKCDNTTPDVSTVVQVHLGYYDTKGSMRGLKGRKVSIACGTLSYSDPFNTISASPSSVNCPRCQETDAYKRLWKPDPNDVNSGWRDPAISAEERDAYMDRFAVREKENQNTSDVTQT